MPEVVEHCRGGATWKTVIPLTLTNPSSSEFASLIASFALTEGSNGVAEEDL